MKRIFLVTILIVSFISCKNDKNNDAVEAQQTVVSNDDKVEDTSAFKKTENYAVVFKWATTDEKLVENNAMQQADQLLAMWKNNIVENVYYDSDAKVDKFSYFPNITFVIKAENVTAAETILNDLIVVKKGIATYSLYPVGTLWLKRDSDVIRKRGKTKSYVAVWNTITQHDNVNAKKRIDENAKEQSDAVLDLWKEGAIENVYFDIEGTVSLNMKTDFVFFVNANTEDEARRICDELPFSKKQLASYRLFQVGVHWMGINED